jgi:tetratricopeptide (TPR) repeat protein
MKQTFTVLVLTTAAAIAGERFDHLVRNDFFAGFTGNAEAMARAMQKTEAVLAENPKHAEALVWHGAGLLVQSRGDAKLFARAMKEMDDAVALEPDNIGVRIPRGAVLLSAARSIGDRNPDIAKMLTSKAVSDYQRAYDLQESDLNSLGEHPLGELLFGLADGNSRLGNMDRAAEFFNRVSTMLPDTVYAKRAAKWQQTKSLTAAETTCVGCHVK